MRRSTILTVSLLLGSAGLAHAATISGHVRDERGAPIANVDLDFVVVATGNEESANGDVTDATGFYATTVSDNVFDVYYTPPPGARFAGHVERNVDLTVNRTVDVVLEDAWFVSGTVLRADTGLPAVNVDLDAEDLSTGETVFTPGDNTDLNGQYSVRIPRGIYRITFDGPPKEFPSDPPQLAHGVLEEISVDGSADLSLPTVTLELGYVVEGELLDSKGDALVGVDLDFLVPGTRQKVFSKNDNTDARGRYSTVMPAGTYDIEFRPPPGALQAAKIRPGVVVSTDVNLGTDVLSDGWSVSGAVRDPDGNFLQEVDLNVTFTSDGTFVPTANDDTDTAGQYQIRLESGTYDLEYRPLVNSLVEAAVRTGEAIFGDRVLSDTVLQFHDEDGDGIADAHDNCPLRANDLQQDQDLDGAGDLCDNCIADANPRQEDNDLDGTGDACDGDDDNDGVPDLTDDDLDGDGLLNVADNCPQAWNPGQENDDADADGNACDPDDGEVEYLEARTHRGFAWRPESGALGYHVYRQRLDWLSGINYGTCFRTDLTAPVFLDLDDPLPGETFVYVVSATTATGEGSLGRRSDGVVRSNLRSCP